VVQTDEKTFSTQFKPRFRDTDGVGHVNNAVFSTYLEIARSEWYQTLLKNATPRDFSFILARMEVDYLNPIHLGASVVVSMWVSRIGTKAWSFSYLIHDGVSGMEYAKATSVQVAYDYQNNCSVELSGLIREKLHLLFNE
jgi:acyl-CoA thioester hydrolase